MSALENVGEVRKAQVQHAGFVVLKSPDIPSMLVETAYISNPAEERRLRMRESADRVLRMRSPAACAASSRRIPPTARASSSSAVPRSRAPQDAAATASASP